MLCVMGWEVHGRSQVVHMYAGGEYWIFTMQFQQFTSSAFNKHSIFKQFILTKLHILVSNSKSQFWSHLKDSCLQI